MFKKVINSEINNFAYMKTQIVNITLCLA